MTSTTCPINLKSQFLCLKYLGTSVSSPAVTDVIGDANVTCSSHVATNTSGICSVSINQGTGMTISVDYGDNTNETFQILGRYQLNVFNTERR